MENLIVVSTILKLNTSPDLALNNIADVFRSAVKQLGKGNKSITPSLVQVSNLYNLFGSEFRFGVSFTKGTTVLRNHIARVFSTSANRKVSRVTAPFNVTRMEDNKSVRDFAFGNLVGETVGIVNHAIVNKPTITIFPDGTITSPKPTTFKATGFIDFRPKNIIDVLISPFSRFNGKPGAFRTTMFGFVVVLLDELFLTVGADSGTIEAHGNLSFPCHSLGCYEQREGFLWLKSDYIIPQLRLN